MPSILESIQNGVGEIILNRPQALNALDLDVMNRIGRTLGAWSQSADVHVVLIRGAGSKAFCAGGDLQLLHKAILEGDENLLQRFFHNEYLIDEVIGRFAKPVISLATHITMGGGMGVCMASRYRIVSDASRWAMPETQIGFFPDVGAGAFLNKCPGSVGMYLALTGAQMNAADALYAGLATHYIAPESIEVFEETLRRAPTQTEAHGIVQEALSIFESEAPMESTLADHRETIDRCFGHASVAEIVHALQEDDDPWAQTTALDLLERASPLSVLVTFEYMQRARTMSVQEVLNLDYALSQNFLSDPDFPEGIRAQVIDKDKDPQWRFSYLTDVPSSVVRAYFESD